MPRTHRIVGIAQGYGCIMCARSCGGWSVPVSDNEARALRRLLKRKPAPPEHAGLELRDGQYVLRHAPNGNCGFLLPDGRCHLHAHFSLAAKPSTCREFPWRVLHTPTDSYWSVTVACTATVARLNEDFREIVRDGAPTADATMVHAEDLARPLLRVGENGSWSAWREARAEVLALASRGSWDDIPAFRASLGLTAGRSAPFLLKEVLHLWSTSPGLSQADKDRCLRQLQARSLPWAEVDEKQLAHFVALELFGPVVAMRLGWPVALSWAALLARLVRVFTDDMGFAQAVQWVSRVFAHAIVDTAWRQKLEDVDARGWVVRS